jgi:hypothetical protein
MTVSGPDMPFGPYYPVVLDTVMRHAERQFELLRLRERMANRRDPGRLWLAGRARELRSVANLVARDWHDGRLSAVAAARELTRHIAFVHEGLARHVGIKRPSCCRTHFVSTVLCPLTDSEGVPPRDTVDSAHEGRSARASR